MADAGKGTLEITRTLNSEGISSPRGKLWGKASVHNILTNEAYTGTLIWGAKAKDKADPVRVEKAFPAIISKAQFRRVNQQLRRRAPKIRNPRRTGSSYLLSGMVRCKACDTPLNGRFAKSGKYAYYVCPSNINIRKDACETPSINARRFEELVVGKIRSNILTEGNIRALVKIVDEEMDGVAREQRKRLETVEDELEDVKRKLGRIWHLVETTDTDMADALRPHQGAPGAADAPGGCGGARQGHYRPAQEGPGRREHHRHLRPGHEQVSEEERADRAQDLHRELREGDRSHARQRPDALHRSHARR